MATTFTIDPSHSSIEFATKHMMVTTVRGRFTEYAGTVDVEDVAQPATARGTFTIKAASITTGNEQRDAHLRSADFFDAETYPELSFTSTSIELAGGNRYRVTGDLTIHGVTRPVTLEAEAEAPFVDPWGNERVAVSARGEINRTDWGLTWNQTLEAGRLLVSEKVTLAAEVALVRPVAAPAVTA